MNTCLRLTVVLVVLGGAATTQAQDTAPAAEQTSMADVLARYDSIYARYSRAFKEQSDTAKRRALIKKTTKQLNELLAPHLLRADIAELFESFETSILIDLEPSLVKVIEKHPSDDTRAHGLLTLARYYGHNHRRDLCKGTLAYLKKFHGKREFGTQTFGEIAEQEAYYFVNLAVGCKAPAIIGEDADGMRFRLTDYEGKVVVLRFWGDWCPACRAMFPWERRTVERMRNRPFALIGVNSDPKERLRDAQREKNLTWRSFSDGPTTNGPIARMFQIKLWPTIVVLDGSGVIRYRSRGFDEDGLDALLDKLVTENEAARTTVRKG